MKTKRVVTTFIFLVFTQSVCLGNALDSEVVVLLHGLARTKQSMVKLEKSLSDEGYIVLNLDYPSRSMKIEEIAEETLTKAIASCRKLGAKKIHFVTHSMGGILVRYYMKRHNVPELGRAVMLSPPNGGSEVVDKLRKNFIFKWINGPAGQQLGTGNDSLPNKLGKVDFELGIIAGDRSINLLLSLIIPGSDDGKVSVTRAKVEGMEDFIVLHSSHPFIMKNRNAIKQTLAFLKDGRFVRE